VRDSARRRPLGMRGPLGEEQWMLGWVPRLDGTYGVIDYRVLSSSTASDGVPDDGHS